MFTQFSDEYICAEILCIEQNTWRFSIRLKHYYYCYQCSYIYYFNKACIPFYSAFMSITITWYLVSRRFWTRRGIVNRIFPMYPACKSTWKRNRCDWMVRFLNEISRYYWFVLIYFIESASARCMKLSLGSSKNKEKIGTRHYCKNIILNVFARDNSATRFSFKPNQ